MASSPHRSRWNVVWTVVKTLIAFAIAVALVKIAFFPNSAADEAQSMAPSAEFTQMTVTMQQADITNSLTLPATVQADDASPVRAIGQGEITYIWAQNGAHVEKGERILLIQREVPGEDRVSIDEEGNEVVEPGPTTWTEDVVASPATGTLNLEALLTQQVSVGDTLGSVQPPSFHVTASLSADQMYRIGKAPETANITINNGPPPFDCTGLKVITPKAEDQNQNSDGNIAQGSSSTGVRAECAVPGDQQVFPGLQVTMKIVAGQAEGVNTLPISAVEGRFQKGNVYVPTDNPDQPQKKAVELGLTDGKVIEIKSGLSASEEVLEFIPGQPATPDTGMDGCNPDTGEGC